MWYKVWNIPANESIYVIYITIQQQQQRKNITTLTDVIKSFPRGNGAEFMEKNVPSWKCFFFFFCFFFFSLCVQIHYCGFVAKPLRTMTFCFKKSQHSQIIFIFAASTPLKSSNHYYVVYCRRDFWANLLAGVSSYRYFNYCIMQSLVVFILQTNLLSNDLCL